MHPQRADVTLKSRLRRQLTKFWEVSQSVWLPFQVQQLSTMGSVSFHTQQPRRIQNWNHWICRVMPAVLNQTADMFCISLHSHNLTKSFQSSDGSFCTFWVVSLDIWTQKSHILFAWIVIRKPFPHCEIKNLSNLSGHSLTLNVFWGIDLKLAVLLLTHHCVRKLN